MISENDDSARARLIKTRRGTQIDESLLPAARRECLEILRAASEAAGDDVIKMVRGDSRRHLALLSDLYDRVGSRALVWSGLGTLRKELIKYRLSEEDKAWELARKARESAGVCGCCGRELTLKEPAYFGADVYVGMWPFYWRGVSKPQICKPRYERTVLCESCAPEWLSPERDDVVTQLCAHCERPMVSRLKLSELRRTLCSESCLRAYRNQLRNEKRAEERKKICEVCGKEFTATRQDAKTCSAGCKQNAYRRRKREVKQNR